MDRQAVETMATEYPLLARNQHFRTRLFYPTICPQDHGEYSLHWKWAETIIEIVNATSKRAITICGSQSLPAAVNKLLRYEHGYHLGAPTRAVRCPQNNKTINNHNDDDISNNSPNLHRKTYLQNGEGA